VTADIVEVKITKQSDDLINPLPRQSRTAPFCWKIG